MHTRIMINTGFNQDFLFVCFWFVFGEGRNRCIDC